MPTIWPWGGFGWLWSPKHFRLRVGANVIASPVLPPQNPQNIRIDMKWHFSTLVADLRFYYLGSSRPSVDSALSALGRSVGTFGRISRFNSAGKNVNPATMHVASPAVITQPRL